MRRLDREERNLRAAVDWTLAHDDPDDGLRIIGATWRWYQQRGRLREARGLLTRLLSASSGGDPRVRIVGLAAEGGLAYWMDDFAAARAAYERAPRARATASGDPVLMADAHYDIGFLSMVAHEGDLLRDHEQQPSTCTSRPGREDGAIRARPGARARRVPGGDYREALDLETQNLAAFAARDRSSRLPTASRCCRPSAGGSARPSWHGAGVRGPALLLGHRQRVRARPQPRHGGDHPARRRRPRARRADRRRDLPAGPREGRDARAGQGAPPPRSGGARERALRRRAGGGAARRGRGDRGRGRRRDRVRDPAPSPASRVRRRGHQAS